MGLCKCPKKKVTSQFCFEHRVNVCEECIVMDHTKCVVQSYRQWLEDADYKPVCVLCNQLLEAQDCSRLMCYDVFHTACLERWGDGHPPHTAPAGFKCPGCQGAFFPSPQMASPVALALKRTLATWTWARRAMGLSLTDGADGWSDRNGGTGGKQSHTITESRKTQHDNSNSPNTHSFTNGTARTSLVENKSYSAVHHTSPSPAPSVPHSGAGAISVNVGLSGSGAGIGAVVGMGSGAGAGYRKPSSSDHALQLHDEDGSSDTDDNKYKRRSAVTWFKRWWRSYQPLGTRGAGRGGRRRMLLLISSLVLATLVLLLFAASRGRTNDDQPGDPMLDPLNNPNIHVQGDE